MSDKKSYDFSYLFKNSELSKTMESIREMQRSMVPDSVTIAKKQIRQMQESLKTPITSTFEKNAAIIAKSLKYEFSDPLTKNMQNITSSYLDTLKLESPVLQSAELISKRLGDIVMLTDRFDFSAIAKSLDAISFNADTVVVPNEIAELTSELSDEIEDLFINNPSDASNKLTSTETFTTIIWPFLLTIIPLLITLWLSYQDSVDTEQQYQGLLQEQRRQTVVEEQQLLEEQKQTELLQQLVDNQNEESVKPQNQPPACPSSK